jgi:hypothetical protein
LTEPLGDLSDAHFESLIFSSWFEERSRPLPVYGPTGNSEFPSTSDFVRAFFNSRSGVYRYLGLVLVPQEEGGYELQPHNVAGDPSMAVFHGDIYRPTPHGLSMGLCQL